MVLRNNTEYRKRFRVLFESERQEEDGRFIRKPTQYMVEQIYDEYGAWDKGEWLAKKLKIKIDLKEYRAYARQQLLTYIRASCA